ncbi:MAG TPA: aminotransferase class I/II-fold pyridoxal phosphate-dependent enzyme [Thermoanaerobaculia bacterium]|nr:aminotransferase class I/II-fold pyridoxal phosphate-dependent enzyme [Thermoanaerobaculia bacterium]
MDKKANDIETLLIHADRALNPSAAVAAPIYQTATFCADSAEDFAVRSSQPRHPEYYTRFGNPTQAQAESVLAVAEGAEAAVVTASGMAAMSSAVLAIVGQGDHVVAQENHYGGTLSLIRDFLPRFGVEMTQVDQTSVAAFAAAMRPNTKLVIVESPSNPVMKITDLQAVAAVAKERGALTIADNTFATPMNQRPLDLGIDLAVHSATKYFSGHSDVIAGVVMGSAALVEKVWNANVILGATLGPFDAWLLLRGMRTLSLRVAKQNANALVLAQFLERHPAVKVVNYPGLKSHPQHELASRQMSGFGGMLSFDLKGGYEAASRFLKQVRLPLQAASLGGVETLVVSAAANFRHYLTTEEAERIGLPLGLVRVSAGIEAADDLIADFEQALM